MVEFLIEIPHEERNCLELIQLLGAQGDLANFEWGCQDGVHSGWAMITANSEAEACLVVPSLMRRQARVVRVSRFDAATVAQVRRNEPARPSPAMSLAMVHMYRAFPCWW